MDDPSDHAPAPPGWIEALEESEAQIAAGQTVPLEPLLAELHELADQVEAEQRQKAPAAGR